MVPLINNAGATLRWFVEDVWAQFGDEHTRPGVPLLPSERKNADGSAARVGGEALRAALKEAARTHLPDWPVPRRPGPGLRDLAGAQSRQPGPGHPGRRRALAQDDALHLAAMFGLDHKTAIRYADNARQLLVMAAEEQDPAAQERRP
jgi:hypothetical protein